MLCTYSANLEGISHSAPELWPFDLFTLVKYHTSKKVPVWPWKVTNQNSIGTCIISIDWSINNIIFIVSSRWTFCYHRAKVFSPSDSKISVWSNYINITPLIDPFIVMMHVPNKFWLVTSQGHTGTFFEVWYFTRVKKSKGHNSGTE